MAPESSTDGNIAGVVLAAGHGTRLHPLTLRRPKPLCPVGNISLVDGVIDRVAAVVGAIAVNVHAGREQMEKHFAAGQRAVELESEEDGRGGAITRTPVMLSFEEPAALGTAGAIGQLRWWIDGRATLVVNGDSWATSALEQFVDTWDRERVAVLLHDPSALDRSSPPAFTANSRLAATLLPWREANRLEATPSGLYRESLAPAAHTDRLQTVACGGQFFDCGTPSSYLAANLAAAASAGGALVAAGAAVHGTVTQSVVGDATIDGSVVRSVVWSGAEVTEGEALVDAIRADVRTTVLIR